MTNPADSIAAVREYYDQNTRLFSWLGSTPRTKSIHRALWPSGVQTLEQALNQSNQLVLQALQPLLVQSNVRPFSLADLGCGIGGTLIFLLNNLPQDALGLGLTISPVQARLAQKNLLETAVRLKGLIVEGDFLSLPLAGEWDALISIEAFVHTSSPACYLAEAARVLRPGGRLVLVDDFLTNNENPSRTDQRSWLQSYRSGWRVPGLSTPADVSAQAGTYELRLVEDRDLTPWLRFRTLPPCLTALILSMGERLPLRHAIIPSMLGSLALQHCLRTGLVQYHLLVFEKQR